MESIAEYLKAVRADILENADYFIMETAESGDGPFPVVPRAITNMLSLNATR